MRRRRPLLILLLILLAVSILSTPATRTSREPATTGTTGTTGAAGAAGASGTSGAPDVRATLPADRSVRVTEGRVVELRVTSLQPDTARIDSLGLKGPVGPALEGPTFRFVAEPVGTHTVRLDVAGTKVGTIDIVAAPDQR